MAFMNEYSGNYNLIAAMKPVHCPWHEDSEASAHINIESRVFHCKACDLGLSETAFVQKHMGCATEKPYSTQNSLKERSQVTKNGPKT